jgi:hypothetical protein
LKLSFCRRLHVCVSLTRTQSRSNRVNPAISKGTSNRKRNKHRGRLFYQPEPKPQPSNRKNLAGHVSLSSIFTMSRNRPQIPITGQTSVKAKPSNFLANNAPVRSPGPSPILSVNPSTVGATGSASLTSAGSNQCPKACQHPF